MSRAVIVYSTVTARCSWVTVVRTFIATILSDFRNPDVIFMDIRPPFLPDHRTSWLGDVIVRRSPQE